MAPFLGRRAQHLKSDMKSDMKSDSCPILQKKKNCNNVKKNKRNPHGLWRAANGTRRLRSTTPLAARPVTDCRSDALSHGVRRERRKYRGRGVTSRRPEPSSSAVLNLFHKSVGSVFVFLHAACILQRNCDSTNMYMYIYECM